MSGSLQNSPLSPAGRNTCGAFSIGLYMPLMKLCGYPGCSRLIPQGENYCPLHKKKAAENKKAYQAQREKQRTWSAGTSAQRGYGYRWRQARQAFLRQHPFCIECEKRGIIKPATDVDHIKPHKGDMALFWDQSNWQPLCHTCHSKKTAREDGGFGNSHRFKKIYW